MHEPFKEDDTRQDVPEYRQHIAPFLERAGGQMPALLWVNGEGFFRARGYERTGIDDPQRAFQQDDAALLLFHRTCMVARHRRLSMLAAVGSQPAASGHPKICTHIAVSSCILGNLSIDEQCSQIRQLRGHHHQSA